jgi:hypothetical protein
LRNVSSFLVFFVQCVFLCLLLSSCSDDHITNNNPSGGGAYSVRIDANLDVPQGDFTRVDVVLERADHVHGLGGFNILIAYDATALSLQSVDVNSSALYDICKWEYFTYSLISDGNCGANCPTGLIRIIGIADTDNGAIHPVCSTPILPATMFSMNFLVSNDRTLNCSFIPIRFFWTDYNDNVISNENGKIQYIARAVYGYLDSANEQLYNPYLATFPGYNGVPIGSWHHGSNNENNLRQVDFHNGGIDIQCSDSIIIPSDTTLFGDINLNKVAFEIDDAVMFTNYFVKGYGAFVWVSSLDEYGNVIGYRRSIAATDINEDGKTLTVADLAYMIHIISGDPTTLWPAIINYTITDSILSVDEPIGGAAVVIAGKVAPALLANNMEMMYGTREDNNTYVIIYPNMSTGGSCSGNILNANGEILSVEIGTVTGAMALPR